MANLLAHALAAMAFCALMGTLFGLPAISWGVFLSGFCAMIIELDYDDLSPNHRSPIGHSIFFGVIWTIAFSVLIWAMTPSGIISKRIAGEFSIALISAYTTHLVIDSFTKEGIYSFPSGFKLKKWVKRLSKGEKVCWEYWMVFKNNKFEKLKRHNDDPILNACVSIPSLLGIIVFVALMPL
ncbi:MAG: hypothetical protein JSV56_02500 [Methanomassiliicoccales archaeon]|nr:MAG: hypothetical protein JSV56_02500 [Methanomassiliicoccales archaeon]